MNERNFELSVNGVTHAVHVPPVSRLLDVLRHDLQLTGAKEGCGEGECGSCSVLMNGELVNSCLVPVAQAVGASIVTIEGVGSDDRLHPVQKAFLECGGAQCGICTPGMILATLHLLDKYPQPSYEQIREGLNGNLCRCTGYTRIFESVAKAAEAMGRNDSILEVWNRLNAVSAAAEVLPCCGSQRWASELAHGRPYSDAATLLEQSDAIWLRLAGSDWDEAFASHPRIGDKKAPVSATAKSADWSSQEQSSVATTNAETLERLRIGNSVYEERFGRTYIVCAAGKSVAEMLAILEKRLINDDEKELLEAAEQQRQITQLRLRKWLRL